MRHLFDFGAVALYLASLALYLSYLYESRRWVGRCATVLLASGVLLHYVALLERSRWVHTVPYNDVYGSMSLFAWLLAVTYLALETFHRQRAVGPFVLLFLIAWLVLAMALAPAAPTAPPAPRSPLLALHITLEVLGYAAFGLSFIFSLIYLVQNRVLRERRPGLAFWQFPALDQLDRMMRSSVLVGLAALLVGTALGFVWSHRVSEVYDGRDPKVIATVLILLLYAVYLWLARSAAWRGARAARLCAGNFLLVMFSYTLVNFYLTGFHRYF
jgi:HemX protein